MRIALVTDQYPPQLGGVPDVVHLLLQGFLARGHDVRVYAPQLPDAAADSRVVRIPTLTFMGGQGNIVSPFGMKQRLEEFKPDIVHLHTVGFLVIAARRAAAQLGIPTVGTYHGSLADYLYTVHLDIAPMRAAVNAISNAHFNACTALTAPSRGALERLRREGVEQPTRTYISNPIDLSIFEREYDTQESKEMFGIHRNAVMVFGRIAAEKNLEDTISAFEQIVKSVDAQLVCIGDGPYRPHMEQTIDRRGLRDRTLFLGRLSGEKLVRAVRACEVMLTASFTEVQPLTVLQSLACGVPVVGTRAGGVPECIRDGETGFVIDLHDINGYAKHCTQLLQDDALRASFGAAAKREVASLAPQEIAKNFEDLFVTLTR